MEALPVDAAVRAASIELALSGGEDYALVFAVRPGNVARLLSRLRRAGARGTPVGRFFRGGGIRLLERGRSRPLPETMGWDHLATSTKD